ncbi:sigma-54-dependent transcriptional regulator [Desulfurivibrio alkaliphilus]|uniref:Two component, sigma54 specific, transcriptional regulator, Fis family n=1 Tax=Desulfurivibrio alkaliphilus (strain DSM 19089 / UNIQEM U267 / AHT2) TaxID=589865 RepID=D6Z2J3_DESAT|nr:sigma-54 dependent transcriptional regulator [Desulfurivibrio alkaliphilus]ADH85768.1 two component, sigma54 specific, transcriptional regulator, Fis family [Desulfurivibrio alkaliphilus AHT 2]
MKTILVVDDEPNYLVILSELLRDEGYETFTAGSAEEGLEIARHTDLDLIITDMRMPGMDGLELLKTIKGINPSLPVIMITAFGEVDKAVAAMRAGAFNYLTKPFDNDELLVSIRKALEHYEVVRENTRLRAEISERTSYASMVGKSHRMREIYGLIEKVAPTPTSVLITGESGTGKELVARAVHSNSPRSQAPFISINCAGLPESLLESELFGHEKGAFTGAVALRKGRFELADGGTLFLDEVGEMPLSLQAKLLRVIQERAFERVGGSRTIRVEVRLIAATNKDLKEEVEAGNFREDLYYRLNVVHIHLPPLRERTDDIPALAHHFVAKFARELHRPGLQIMPETISFLSTLPWEGNIRELENTIERAAVLCSKELITPADVQPESSGDQPSIGWGDNLQLEQLIPPETPLPEIMNTIEKKMVAEALAKADHVQTRAADSLGITKSLLQYKMKKYGLQKK